MPQCITDVSWGDVCTGGADIKCRAEGIVAAWSYVPVMDGIPVGRRWLMWDAPERLPAAKSSSNMLCASYSIVSKT